jgi:hypothetical protein
MMKSYQKRVNRKKAEEERITTERVVKQLVDDVTFLDFKFRLIASNIANRDHPGFGMLLSELTKSEQSAVQQQKLGLLITGRDPDLPDAAVWSK